MSAPRHLGAQARHHAFEKSQGPPAVEHPLRRLIAWSFQLEATFRRLDLERRDRLATAAFFGAPAIALVGGEVLQGYEQEGTEAPPCRIGRPDRLFFEQ